ncbi:MAG: hypothetical protein LBD04_05595 [Synergistaceae bacterium]|jgi:hypothetical protein|nr:hypothetical protein [Synergistaceae bacterium]
MRKNTRVDGVNLSSWAWSKAWLVFLAALVFALARTGLAAARGSKEWEERLNARTATLWVEGQKLGEELVLNSRGLLQVTWLERGLTRRLDEDRDVEEWLLRNLSYYSSNRKDTQAKLKGRDVFLLRYKASKRWNFDPCQVTIGGYRVTSGDVLTKKEYWKSELVPGKQSAVAVVAPSLQPGQKVEIRYGDDLTEFEAPRK